MNKRHPQHPEEYKKLLEWVREARSVLEIGSRYGLTMVDLARNMAGKRIVAVDWPDKEGYEDDTIATELVANAKMLEEKGFDVHLILADSHHPDTLAQVTKLGPYDFIFIDGDHSYKGVKQDYEYYGPLGKQVIFHDIVQPTKGRNKGLEVWKFWAEIKGKEFIAVDSLMGLGRVWNAS
jgi:predicted O-methyltransferase YrrM